MTPAPDAEFVPPHPIRALARIAELLGHTFGETCAYPVSHETSADGCQRPADLGWTVESGWLRVARTCSAGHESAWRDIFPLVTMPVEFDEPAPAPADSERAVPLGRDAGDPYVVQWDGTALGGTVIAGHVDRLGGVAVARTDETGTGGDDMLIHPPDDRPMLVLRKGSWLAVDEGRWATGPSMSDAIEAALGVQPRGVGFPPPRTAAPAVIGGGRIAVPAALADKVQFVDLPRRKWTIHIAVLAGTNRPDPAPAGFEPFAVTMDHGVATVWSKGIET